MMVTQGYTDIYRFLFSHNVLLGQFIFPVMMMGIYYMSGFYTQVFRKSRLQEFITTFFSSFINMILLFFIALINDTIEDRIFNYELMLILWGCLFGCVYIVRFIITGNATRNIHGRKWQFNTLIVGNGSLAHSFVMQMNNMEQSLGYNVIGYVNISGENPVKDSDKPVYEFDEISRVCSEHNVKEIIVVPTKISESKMLRVVNKLFPLNLPIKISPDMYNILISKVRINTLCGEPLVDVSGTNLSASAENLKRIIDVSMSVLALLLLSPFLLLIMILIKLDSKGSIMYHQERIGYHNKTFKIYKFRTMVEGAEAKGVPQLTCENDSRVTPLGRFMRKYRIDELPQFWNVIKGDMSIVGPRPERRYYIDQIIKEAPYYVLLHQVRPGITSMGMVKFGYATNVDEMIKRSRYDLIYIENMSLLNDMKIILYTIKTVLTGRGM